MVKIERIIPDSTADKAGLKKSDKIISINGKKVDDYIDYLYETSEVYVDFEIKRKNGLVENVRLQRKAGEELGIEFKEIIFDGLKQCHNNCIFCFVQQQPKDLRSTLNQKDDDYRFSFLQGSFITLTNLSTSELERIIEKNLSPLNISVHTTNPELRVEMMKNPRAAEINQLLKLFKKNGISFHTQIVVCPGYNDKKELDRTLNDLIDLYPAVLSVGIVPVGLTAHREGLPYLRNLTEKEMENTLEQIKFWQHKAADKHGENFIYAADEFYLNTNTKLPQYDEYNGFPQLENGIGLTVLLKEELKGIRIPDKLSLEKNIALITSELGSKAIECVLIELNKINNLNIETLVVENKFFGSRVTVAGLLTAEDIGTEIKKINSEKYDKIIIPDIVLNDDNKFLDGVFYDNFLEDLDEYNISFVKDLKELLEVIIDV